MREIEQKDLALFEDAAGRRELMAKYGDSETAFLGHNVDGEMVMVSISHESIVVATYQENHWIREDWYDANGEYECETYKGRWS